MEIINHSTDKSVLNFSCDAACVRTSSAEDCGEMEKKWGGGLDVRIFSYASHMIEAAHQSCLLAKPLTYRRTKLFYIAI